jgi:putative ABC transport system substrate-binding protein
VVFANVADPMAGGFVATLAHPGGNMTGFSNFEFAIGGKWVGLLREVAPSTARIGIVIDPENVNQIRYVRSIEAVAPSLAVEVTTVAVHNAAEIESGIAAFAAQPGGALIVLPSAVAGGNSKTILGVATRYRLPAIYPTHSWPTEGGLMSYGSDLNDMYGRAASYVDRILRGEKPADLPVQLPTKFDLVINLKTAKALGLTVPLTLQAAANEVIE